MKKNLLILTIFSLLLFIGTLTAYADDTEKIKKACEESAITEEIAEDQKEEYIDFCIKNSLTDEEMEEGTEIPEDSEETVTEEETTS